MRPQLLRALRAVPGYERLRGPVLRQLRKSPRFRKVLRRVRAARLQTANRASLTAPIAGRTFSAEEASHLPVALIVCRGLDEGEVETLANRIEQAQLVTAAFRPVFVLDTSAFGPLRLRSFAFEHVLGRSAWEQLYEPSGWTDYLLHQLSTLRSDYGAATVVPVESRSLPSADLLAVCCGVDGAAPPGSIAKVGGTLREPTSTLLHPDQGVRP